MQNPVVLLNGYGLAFFHGIPFFFREPADCWNAETLKS
jgi:hypothetical protein